MLSKTQCKALEAYIRERDIAQANINEVLQEAGIVPEMVANLNLSTGEVLLKGAVEDEAFLDKRE